jgi:predicted nucleotide-binding protein
VIVALKNRPRKVALAIDLMEKQVEELLKNYRNDLKFACGNELIIPDDVVSIKITKTGKPISGDSEKYGDLWNLASEAENVTSIFLPDTTRNDKIVVEDKTNTIVKKPSLDNRVFIVHGRDYKPLRELKAILAEFGFDPIVLHEQPSGSRTIVEKLEKYSNVGYAFVILTPDDFGSEMESLAAILSNSNELDMEDIFDGKLVDRRARQNVVLEFGYFIGLLGRDRVCCLHTGDVELPSDMHGIVYIPFEKSVKEVRDRIIKELKAAGYKIKL